MSNKVALVSGANGNLGAAVVEEFLAHSNKVSGLMRKSNSNLKNENYLILETDLLNEAQSEESVNITIKEFGKIDVAVLTAGGFAMGNIDSTSADDLEKYFKLNFITAYNLVRPLVRQMKGSENRKIFLIGSSVGMDTTKGSKSVAYALSKSSLVQLANMINADMDSTGVQAYVVVPQTIDTPQNRESMPNADFSKWVTPQEIAEIIYRFAISDNNLNESIINIAKERK